jgi:hypothetical protein
MNTGIRWITIDKEGLPIPYKQTNENEVEKRNKFHYIERGRLDPNLPPIEELEEGACEYRFKRECICCKSFTQSNGQYKNEIGTCSILGDVSEWGVCAVWDLNKTKYKVV